MRQGIVDYVLVLGAGLLLSGDLDAGSLEPPGPPAPTMKALDQVEPRIPISSLPITIAAPGSYYLTRDVTGVSGQAGITISASFVVLDMNGFALTGVPLSLDGISATSGTEHVVIKNGAIRNWGARGIGAGLSTEVHIENLRIDGNGSDGLSVGSRSIVRDTTSTSNGQIGIVTASNSTVTRCTAGLNTSSGFWLGANSVVSGSTAQANTGNGFALNQASLATDCTAQQNGVAGFALQSGGNRIVHSMARGNAVGILGTELSTIEGCSAASNSDDGIRVGSRGVVRGNVVRSNMNDGIHATGSENRIEDNEATLNGTGFRVDGINNLVVKNSFSVNGLEHVLGPANKVGTISADPTTANPWANFDL